MQKGFWGDLKFPIVGLSPMDGVTDAPWRFIAKKYGQPDVIYTEFVSVEGLWRIHKRGEMEHRIWKELAYDGSERPVVVQLFGSDPESFYMATKIVCEMGFDGIDINMGCPSPGLERAGGGAGLIRDQGRAAAVIEATRRGVRDWVMQEKCNCEVREIPVTLKTRIGSEKPDESWWKFLAGQEMPVVAMHGRTFKQLYSGESDWDILFKAGEIIRESGTLFLANGDIKKMIVDGGRLPPPPWRDRNDEVSGMTLDGVRLPRHEYIPRNDEVSGMTKSDCRFAVELNSGKKIDLTGKADGVLIGKNAMGNPWILKKDGYVPTLKERLEVAVEHAEKFEEVFDNEYIDLHRSTIGLGVTGGVRLPQEYPRNDDRTSFFPMRKHLAWYAHGFPEASELRRKLVMTNSSEEVRSVVEEFVEQNKQKISS